MHTPAAGPRTETAVPAALSGEGVRVRSHRLGSTAVRWSYTETRRTAVFVLVLTALWMALPAAAGAVPISFGTFVPLAASSPNHVVVGDFTGDGLPDIAVANGNIGIDVFAGTGAGSFAPPVLTQVSDGPIALAAADMDRDGGLDLVVTTSLGDLVVLHGYDDGTFDQVSRTTVGDVPLDVAVGDANRDGKLDAAVTSSLSESVGVFLGDGAGGFTGGRFYGTASQPIGVVLTDLTRDGRPDLAYACVAGGSVSVRAGDGTGRFGAALTAGSLADPNALVAGDVDGDGAQELVVTQQTSGEIAVLERQTAPSEQWVVDGEFAAGTGPRDVVLADFDRDSDLDVVVANDHVGGSRVLAGDGAGSFAAPSPVSGLGFGACLAAADLDRDGPVDFVLCSRPPSGPASAMAILNGTENARGVAYEARNDHSAASNSNDLEVADFDRDGNVDIVCVDADTYLLQCVRGDGDGGVVETVSSDMGAFYYVGAAADFDRDGILDMALRGSAGIGVAAGDGLGGFAAPDLYFVSDYFWAVAAGDVDRDGDPDLVVSRVTPSLALCVLLNDGSAEFSTGSTLTTSDLITALAFADLDRDGRPDAVGVDAGGFVYPFMGDGSGGLSAQPGVAVASASEGLAVGDVDRDGDSVRIVLGDGSGGLSAGAFVAVGEYPRQVEVIDLDNDGDLDFVVGAVVGKTVHYALNDGSGGFGAAVTLSGPAAATIGRSVAAGDLDSDGKVEIIASFESSTLSWWPSDHTPPSGTVALDGAAAWSQDLTVSVDSNVTDAVEMRTRDGGMMWGAWVPYAAHANHTLAAGDAASRGVEAEYRDTAGNVLALSDTIGLDTVAPQATDDVPTGWQPGPVIVTMEGSDATSGVAEIRYSVDDDEFVVAGDDATVVFPIWKRSGGHGEFKLGYVVADAAGNQWGPDPVLVQVDRIPPQTTDTADHEKPYLMDAEIDLPATDEGSGVSGTWAYWVNETDPRLCDGWIDVTGAPLRIPFHEGDNTGVIRIWY